MHTVRFVTVSLTHVRQKHGSINTKFKVLAERVTFREKKIRRTNYIRVADLG